MTGKPTGFAERWSKRKAEARKQTEDVLADEPEVDKGEGESDTISDSDEMLGEEDFDDVDFEALDKGSDYTRFMQANVPATIQKKALRQLWSSDEVFEVLDGMAEYDEDFTGDGLGGKALKTAYKVGRGFIGDKDGADEVSAETTVAEADEGRQTEELPKLEGENDEQNASPTVDGGKQRSTT